MNKSIKYLVIAGILLSVFTCFAVYSVISTDDEPLTKQSKIQAKYFDPEENYIREVITYDRYGTNREERNTHIREKWVIKVDGVIYPIDEELFNSLSVGDIVEIDKNYNIKLIQE